MFDNKTKQVTDGLAHQASMAADQSIKSGQRLAREALDELSSAAQALRCQSTPLLKQASDRASDMAHRSMDSLRDSALQLREQARHSAATSTHYIRSEPVKSVLMAAATGALVMGVINLLRQRVPRD